MTEMVLDLSKIVTDPVLLAELARQGIDPADVDFDQDYAPRSLGKRHSPNAKFYTTKSGNAKGKQFMVVSGLPMVDALGNKNVAGWDDNGSDKNPRYTEKNNLFKASVDGTKIVLQVKNDQPDGRKQGDKLTYQAQLYLNNVLVNPVNPNATRLPIDPTNSNYSNNVLEWNYGIALRRLRLIEGHVLGSWVFASNPNGEVRIKYNQSGDYRLRLGQFATDADTEVVPASVFASATYPFTVSDEATYYPDANPETTSVDGSVRLEYAYNSGVTWSTIHDATDGTSANPTTSSDDIVHIRSDAVGRTDKWLELYRAFYLFDTSPLPDDYSVTDVVLSIRSNAKSDGNSWIPNISIYDSTPASNTDLVVGDFDQVGVVALAATIDYADWSIVGYNDFVFNANGLAAISKTGISKFSARNVSYDVANVAPTWAGYKLARMNGFFSEQGTGYKPKLVVTYTTPVIWNESISDGIKSGETITAGMVYGISLTDGLKGGDVHAPGMIYGILASDGTKQGDTLLGWKVVAEALADGTKQGDSLSVSQILGTILTDGLKVGETPSPSQILGILLTDGTKHGETLSVGQVLGIVLADGIKSGDSLTVGQVLGLLLSEGIKSGDSLTVGQVLGLLLSEGIKSGDSLSVRLVLNLLVSDGIKSGDTSIPQLVYNLSLIDGITLSDVLLMFAILRSRRYGFISPGEMSTITTKPGGAGRYG